MAKVLLINTPTKTITVEGGSQSENVREAERALVRATVKDPEKGIYRRGDKLVRVSRLTDDTKSNGITTPAGTLQIVEVKQNYMQYRLGDIAEWEKTTRNGPVRIDPPLQVARIICDGGFTSITPLLTGIVEVPVLRPDGTILDKPGYDKDTGIYFDPGDTKFPVISEHPSRQDARNALKLLREILECPGVDVKGNPITPGFPFIGEVDRAVAVAALMSPLVRYASPHAPLLAFDAVTRGTGKTLLSYLPAYIAMGRSPKMIAQWQDQAEEKRRLMGVLLKGTAVNVFDNVAKPFESDALCLILTSPTFSERIIRTSDNPDVPTNVTFVVTGNNLTIVGDLTRRTVLCRLDANMEFPEEREFEVNLNVEVIKRRGELAGAILTIVRAYRAAGAPPQRIPEFGSFEGWSDNVRAPLAWLGMADPCGNQGYLHDANPEGEDLAALLTTWHDQFTGTEVTAKYAVRQVNGNATTPKIAALEDAIRAIDQRLSATLLGNFIRRHKGQIKNGLRFVDSGRKQGGSTMWRVETT